MALAQCTPASHALSSEVRVLEFTLALGVQVRTWDKRLVGMVI